MLLSFKDYEQLYFSDYAVSIKMFLRHKRNLD